MIVFEAPERYRGTIEVYPQRVYPTSEGDPSVEWRWWCKDSGNVVVGNIGSYGGEGDALAAVEAMYAWASSPDIPGIENGIDVRDYVVPWRLVVRDRHGDITTTGAVY
ncbi:hypothetical protein SEA_ODAY_80 [Gordonia phage ODay]|nr:hypothetical protein SEA_ODAY_80 [Gordonia phage ODay]